MTSNKCFGPLGGPENTTSTIEGKRVFMELAEKFGLDTNEGCDLIMNSLCFAMVCMLMKRMNPDNYPYGTQLIYKIIKENLELNAKSQRNDHQA